jgi:prepilin-type N-terminal cleavage/methylation domain-containing protein
MKKDNGVTLIELLVVMVIAAILVGGIYTLFMTQQRSYSVQDQVTGVQQDARVALTILARDIRMAGFWIGEGGSSGFNGVSIHGLYNYAVVDNNGGTSNPDEITVVTAAEAVSTVQEVDGNRIRLQNLGSFDTEDNKYVTFEDEKQLYEIQSTGAPNPTDIQVNGTPLRHLDDFGAQAYLVKAITYKVENNALRRDENTGAGAQPLVGDGVTTIVEDLQFAYQVSEDANWYNAASEFPTGRSQADIRMVRINITVRTAKEDATVADADDMAKFNQPALEDHTDNLKGPDAFRRRVYTTVVKVRNL